MKRALLCLAAALAAASPVFSQSVSFKLTGGLAWINGGDFNTGVAGESTLIAAAAQTISGGLKGLSDGPFGHLEIITRLSSRLGLGFGGGYGRASAVSQIASRGVDAGGLYDATNAYNGRVSVIPFSVNLHYLVPLSTKFTLDAFAGPVFAIVQINIANPTTSTANALNQLVTFTASQTAMGGQGGLGLSYGLSNRIDLILDGFYRFGRVTNLQGNWALSGSNSAGPISGSSSTYYLWVYRTGTNGAYSRLGFFDEPGPTDPSASGAKKATIDISGFVVSAGLKIRF